MNYKDLKNYFLSTEKNTINAGGSITLPYFDSMTLNDVGAYGTKSRIMSKGDIVNGPTSVFMHDVLAFAHLAGGVFSLAYERRLNGTWETDTFPTGILSQRSRLEHALITTADRAAGYDAIRFTVEGNIAWSQVRNILLAWHWMEGSNVYDITIETSGDDRATVPVNDRTYTQRGGAIDFDVAGGAVWSDHQVNYWGGDSTLRLTIVCKTVDTILTMGQMRFMSSRLGDQGRGPEEHFPFEWDSTRKMKFLNDINIQTNTGQLSINFAETANNTNARIYWASGQMYLQAGANGVGATGSAGEIKFTGFYGWDLPPDAVSIKVAGAQRPVLHTNNLTTHFPELVRTDSAVTNFNTNIIKNAVLSATPGDYMTVNPGFVNDWGFARHRGATMTATNISPTTVDFDDMFDAKANEYQFNMATMIDEATAAVLEFTNLPVIDWAHWIGISFESDGYTPDAVVIETYSNTLGVWEEQYRNEAQNGEPIIVKKASYTGLATTAATSGIRIKMWGPNAISGAARIANIFAWDYNSGLGTTLYMDRSGGNIYGSINISETMTLQPQTVQPTNPTTGTVAVADGVNWNPMGLGVEHCVIWLGGAWKLVASA